MEVCLQTEISQRHREQSVCVREGVCRDGFMSHLTKLRSLKDISSTVQLRIITHTHTYMYLWMCVGDGSVHFYRSDDIMMISTG